MKYYQVKKEYDNFKKRNGDIYIGMELYTETEVEKQQLNKNYMDIVTYPKNKSYFCFGARFNIMQERHGG